MGGAGLPWLVYGAVLVVLALGAVYVVVPWMRTRQARADELAERGRDVVAYEVPTGEDPAAVLTALAAADLPAVPKVDHGRRLVLVDAASGDPRAVRERARRVIAEAPYNTQGDRAPGRRVVFLDE